MAGSETVKKNRKATTNIGEVIKSAMKVRGYTNEMLGKELGYAGQSGASMLVSGRRIRVDSAIAALDILGFDVIVKDRNGANRDNVWKLEMYEAPEGDAE